MPGKIQSLKNEEFQAVYRHGRSKADSNLVMYIMENGLKENRLGISVSKKNGNSVVRSRLKRIIKEAYRLNQHRLEKGIDIVFIARNSSIQKKSTDLEKSVMGLSHRFRIVCTEE